MPDDPEDGSFESFGKAPTPGLTSGGLDLGGDLTLPTSVTDPLAQPETQPDYYQPIPPPVAHEPENILQEAYDWATSPDTTEPGYVDPIEQERIDQDMASQQTLDETVIPTPGIDY